MSPRTIFKSTAPFLLSKTSSINRFAQYVCDSYIIVICCFFHCWNPCCPPAHTGTGKLGVLIVLIDREHIRFDSINTCLIGQPSSFFVHLPEYICELPCKDLPVSKSKKSLEHLTHQSFRNCAYDGECS